MNREEIGARLRMNEIPFEAELPEKLEIYLCLLLEWNTRMDLTAVEEEEDLTDRHFVDSLTVLRTDLVPQGASFIDVGTGAGFPGMVLAMARPDLKVVLMDALNKRIRFLQDTIDQLGLANVTAVHARAEELARKKEFREKFDLCCSRAVANLATLSEYCLPFVRTGGQFVSYKTEQVQEEIEKSRKAVHALGGGNAQTVFFTLPGTEYKRSLVMIDKVSPTPSRYPRKAGTPSKEPIS